MIKDKTKGYLENAPREDGVEKVIREIIEKPDDSTLNYINYVGEMAVKCSPALISAFGIDDWLRAFQESYDISTGDKSSYKLNSPKEATVSCDKKLSITLIVNPEGFRFFYDKYNKQAKVIINEFISRLRKEK
jgi:hypothetical protein